MTLTWKQTAAFVASADCRHICIFPLSHAPFSLLLLQPDEDHQSVVGSTLEKKTTWDTHNHMQRIIIHCEDQCVSDQLLWGLWLKGLVLFVKYLLHSQCSNTLLSMYIKGFACNYSLASCVCRLLEVDGDDEETCSHWAEKVTQALIWVLISTIRLWLDKQYKSFYWLKFHMIK